MNSLIKIFIIFILFSHDLYSAEPVEQGNALSYPWSQSSGGSNSFSRIGDFGYPPNPMNDRAKGYLLAGKAQAAITNYGRFIDWDYHPAGLWGNFTYLPAVGFVAGVPGHSYSSNYTWSGQGVAGCPVLGDGSFTVWCSDDAYSDPNQINSDFSWYEFGDTNFVSIVFEASKDRGILGEKLISPSQAQIGQPSCDFSESGQYCLDDLNDRIIISLPPSEIQIIDPNNSNVYGNPINPQSVGLVYPWAMRPSLYQRLDDFDMYNYGLDNEEWTEDDDYEYYGANVAE